jgi:homocitrate synthase NifV
MVPNLVLIDQSLGYALQSKQVRLDELMDMKRKISAMHRMIFDIPWSSLQSLAHISKFDLQDIRVGLQADVDHIQQAHDLGIRQLKLYFDPGIQDVSLLLKALNQAGKYRMSLTLAYLNISTYSLHAIAAFQKLSRDYYFKRLIVGDTANRLDPLATFCLLNHLQQVLAADLEYHCDNARGLATGNVLGAIKSGVRYVAVSIGGIGGYAALEEVLMSAKYLLQIPLNIPRNLAFSCKEILNRMGESVPATKPIIGTHIFAHESGIHVDGVIKKSELYEPFSPETVGLSRMIVIGKHSGTAAIEEKLKELKININPSCVPRVLEKVRELSIRQKGPVSDTQLPQLVQEAML